MMIFVVHTMAAEATYYYLGTKKIPIYTDMSKSIIISEKKKYW